MLSSKAHRDVHEAGAPIISSRFMSGMIASVVGEPRVWASARTSPSISPYTCLWVWGL